MSQNQQEQSEAKLLAYLEGELDPAGRAEIDKHLEAHPQHRKLLEELKGMRDWVRWLPKDPAPPDLVETFQGQLERAALLGSGGETSRLDYFRGGNNPRMRINRWPQLRAAAAIAGLAVGLGAVVYFTLPSLRNSPYAHLPTPKLPNDKIALQTASTNPTGDHAADRKSLSKDGVGENQRNGLSENQPATGNSAGGERPEPADLGATTHTAGPTLAEARKSNREPTPDAGASSSEMEKRGVPGSVPGGELAAPGIAAVAPTAPPNAADATLATPATAEVAEATEPRDQLEQVARQYLSSSNPSYGLPNASGAPARLERAELDRRPADRASSDKAKEAGPEQIAPLLMVILAPDPERAGRQISEYCEANRLPARPVSEARRASAGDASGWAAAHNAFDATAGATPAARSAAGASTDPGATGSNPAPPAGAGRGGARPGAFTGAAPAQGTPGAPRATGRAGEGSADEAARLRVEKKLEKPAGPRPAPGPAPAAAPPAPRPAAPVLARPMTPASPPAPAASVAASGAPGTPGIGAGANLSRGAGPQRSIQAPVGADGASPQTPGALRADQLPGAVMDNTVGGGQKAAASVQRGAVVVRMTVRQASDLQASLSRPVASQFAAIFRDSDRPIDAANDGATGGAKAGATPVPAVAPSRTAGTQGARPSQPQQERVNGDAEARPPATAPAAPAAPATVPARAESKGSALPLEQSAAQVAPPTTAPLAGDDQPVDVVILLQKSPPPPPIPTAATEPSAPANPQPVPESR